MTEKQVQDRIIKKLKEKGAYVIKTHPGLGTPTGAPDIIFFKGSIYGVIECKKSVFSAWRPLQYETLLKFSAAPYAGGAYAENLDEVIEELEELL